jgi:hypothetical protein
MNKEEGKEIEVLDTGCDTEKKWPRSCCWGPIGPFMY